MLSPAYLYSYDNWHLQQDVTLLARFVTKRKALSWKSYTKVHFDIQCKIKYNL